MRAPIIRAIFSNGLDRGDTKSCALNKHVCLILTVRGSNMKHSLVQVALHLGQCCVESGS